MRIFSCAIVSALMVAMSGCNSSPAPLPSNAATQKDPPASLDDAVASDPCAIRLDNIEAALMMYYGLNKQLPASLDALKPLATPGAELNMTCPKSGEAYVYSPAGLLAAGATKKIIVWDASPVHEGKRWCILMPPVQSGSVVSLELVELPESAFQKYVPAIQ